MNFIYIYRAINTQGILIENYKISHSKQEVFKYILRSNLIPISIKIREIALYTTKILSYRLHFMYQLSVLLKSNISLIQSLNIIQKECNMSVWKCILTEIIKRINQGEAFSSALKHYPKLFPEIIYRLVEIGEQTNSLEKNCQLIYQQLQQQQILKQKIAKALQYPCIILIIASVVVSLMLFFVLPEFKAIYQTFDAQLPIATRLLITISDKIADNALYIVVTLACICLGYFTYRKHTPNLIKQEQKVILHLPLFNKLIGWQQLYYFFQTLHITQKSGLTLLEGFEYVLKTLKHPVYHDAIHSIYQKIQRGISFSDSIKREKLFPYLCLQFITAGELSGNLVLFLEKLANWYQDNLINYVNKKIKLIEPMLILLLAVVITGLLFTMYLPIFNLGNIIS
ncbi:type II secretion system F family protein [Arsenophonus sp.]|uniref:type II secretion system F family protein n=1 Tax=Arsenophonus sp. TaxID=1872640 RepID=UPI0028624A25|nr:type II secretion system F family protein [Arsenophonus sp.]MDR5617614.1 type II secretion system F family protein [Arsenophonus sp.]